MVFTQAYQTFYNWINQIIAFQEPSHSSESDIEYDSAQEPLDTLNNTSSEKKQSLFNNKNMTFSVPVFSNSTLGIFDRTNYLTNLHRKLMKPNKRADSATETISEPDFSEDSRCTKTVLLSNFKKEQVQVKGLTENNDVTSLDQGENKTKAHRKKSTFERLFFEAENFRVVTYTPRGIPNKEYLRELERDELRKKKQDLKKFVLNFTLQQKVEDILNIKLCELRAFNYCLTTADISSLGDGRWLNDQIINLYIKIMDSRLPSNTKKAHFMNTFFYTTLKAKGYDGVKRWTKKVNIFDMDMFIFPVHLGSHWCCGAINFKLKRFEYYDSLIGGAGNIFELMRSYLKKESIHKRNIDMDLNDWTDYCPNNIPLQENGYDCGIFAITFMDYLANNRGFDFTQRNMSYFRKKYMLDIWDAGNKN